MRGERTVLDISMGGCIIETQAPMHEDDIFYLQIELEDKQAPLKVAAMVRSVSSRGIAFKFLRSAQENDDPTGIEVGSLARANLEQFGRKHIVVQHDAAIEA